MTLDKFDYVLALAEEKNLTKEAKRLYISQPGLTAYINKLEEYLGIRLFDRTTVPIRITEAGTLYIKKMKQIQKEELQLRMDLKDMADQKSCFLKTRSIMRITIPFRLCAGKRRLQSESGKEVSAFRM